MNTITMPRTKAAKMLDRIREMLALRQSSEEIERRINKEFGIEPLKNCDGEAHSNAMIDDCHACAPRWGLIGTYIKIT